MREHEIGAVVAGAPWFPCWVGVLTLGEAEVVPVLVPVPVFPELQAANKNASRRQPTLNESQVRERKDGKRW